jgi:hypothetical protein
VQALVDVFKDLLQFYLEAVALFEESRFVLTVALDLLKPSIADTVSSFKTHADQLSRLLEAETFAAVQELKDGQVEALSEYQEMIHNHSYIPTKQALPVLDTLDNHWKYESDHDDELRKRADDACSWLTSDDAFSYWLLNRDSNVLVLLGDMGSGKTMTTAFVADSLAHPGRPLCAYYCKDEHEPAKLRNIYRSILFQFLQQSSEIKLRFWKWYKETSPKVQVNPTQSDDKLRELLYDIVSSSRTPVFLVLDALDECKAQSRKELFSLFQQLFENKAPLKVFLSSRYDDNIEADLPSGATRIELRSSPIRDRAIASYLVAGTNLPAALHPKAVEELAARSGGSAIWLRIAVEYIEGSQSASPKGLEMALARLPSSEGLVELYGKLFGKVCGRIQENKALLQRALEILAVARRPLTLEELACAVFTINPVSDEEEESAATLAELDRLAHSVNVFNLVRPFITATKGKDGKNPRLRLVHQSLKELVLRAPPSEWCSAEAMAKRKKGERVAELDADLLQRCVRYLLFDENDERRFFPSADDEARDAELFAIGDVFDNEVGVPVSPGAATPSSRRSSAVSSSEPGLGGFFAYAATYWTSHFSDVSPPERRPNAEQLIALCGKGSQRLKNWVEQWRRLSCSRLPERSFPEPLSRLDPLVIAAMFGPAASVTDILLCGLGTSILAKDSAWTTVTHLIERGDTSLIKSLVVQDTVLQPTLCCCRFLYKTIDDWRWQGNDDAAAAATKDWEEIFEFLISQLRGDLIDCGNDILRRAAGKGCLVLIKKLFAAGAQDAELRQALITPDDEDNSRGGRSLPISHQSIGEAAFWAHADVVRFLCEQPGLESHLRYRNRQKGDTVFHQAARRPSEAVLRTLIRHWPEGVNIVNEDGDTPLIVLVFSNPSGCEAETARLVRLLLREGKADANPGGSCSALRIAVRGGYTTVARLLVVEGGADVLQVVGIDEETGRPFLRSDMISPEDKRGQEQMLKEQMLRTLCSLLPLAVSVEYLV